MMECTDCSFLVVISFRIDKSRQTTHRLHLYLLNHYKTPRMATLRYAQTQTDQRPKTIRKLDLSNANTKDMKANDAKEVKKEVDVE
jgi:hypothetical protein